MLSSLTGRLGDFLDIFGLRRRARRSAIATPETLQDFVATRSAYIAQKTLYGYLQTRMGLEYPKMFRDPVYVESINVAKMHVFAACLSDLTIYAVAEATADAVLADSSREDLALHCFSTSISANAAHAPSREWATDAIGDFRRRLGGTDWQRGARQPENFTRSPLELVRWAPIAPQLKQYDAGIVENSIRFAWMEVRQSFRRRLDREAFARSLV